MGKWTNAAEKLKVKLDANKKMADDLKVIITEIGKLPPGQFKKVMTVPVLQILEKYGISLEE